MSRLLQIIATPHDAEASHTRRLGDAVLDRWRADHPHGRVDTLDLFREPLPAMDAPMAAVLFGRADGFGPEELEPRQAALDAILARFMAATDYLFVTPMWNFGLPYPLKHYFDLVIRPGYTFGFTPSGPVGLLEGRRAWAMVTTGLDYGTGSPKASMNHLDAHLRTLLGFMGIQEVRIVTVSGTELPGAEDRMQEGIVQAGGRLLSV